MYKKMHTIVVSDRVGQTGPKEGVNCFENYLIGLLEMTVLSLSVKK
jgi:hypothetical protein